MSEKIKPTADQFEVAALLLNSVHAKLNVARAIARYEAERNAALAKVEAFGEVARDAYARLVVDPHAFSSDICDRLKPYLPVKPDAETVLAEACHEVWNDPAQRNAGRLIAASLTEALAKRGAKVVVEDASQ
jgi:hypothetical protein